jgi:hypothetical protein
MASATMALVAVSYYRGGRTRDLVLRHVRGLGVHHAQFALHDLVSPLTERVRNAGKKMLAHVGLRGADLLAQRDRAVHHLVVFVPSDVEMPWSSSCR